MSKVAKGVLGNEDELGQTKALMYNSHLEEKMPGFKRALGKRSRAQLSIIRCSPSLALRCAFIREPNFQPESPVTKLYIEVPTIPSSLGADEPCLAEIIG